jgi:hypothetical protein
MTMRIVWIALIALATMMATAGTAGAQGNATPFKQCVEPGVVTVPPGPPPAQNIVGVEVNGQVVTQVYVPGPCGAPGFVQTHGS